MCPAHHESCHYAQRSVQAKQSGKHFKYGVFSKSYGVKKPTSFVCAYRDIIWRRWSDILPEISKTGPFLVLSKSNGQLQGSELLVFQLYSSFCLPYTFRYMFVNACAFSEPRARATAY